MDRQFWSAVCALLKNDGFAKNEDVSAVGMAKLSIQQTTRQTREKLKKLRAPS